MFKTIIKKDGTKDVVVAIPECGDYCDRCGDCLKCHAEDFCYHDEECYTEHVWVEYED